MRVTEFVTENIDQIKTSQFKAWFGNSVVVDKSGNPLVVYHGTSSDIQAFDANRIGSNSGNRGFLGRGFYFTSNPLLASSYAGTTRGNESGQNWKRVDGGNVIPVYLNLKNPLILNSINLSNKSAKILNKISNIDASFTEGARNVDGELAMIVEQNPMMADEITNTLIKFKYDGVILDNGREIVVFNPNQIKSAIGNNGNYDPTVSDLIKERKTMRANEFITENADQVETPEFKAWFGNSVVVDDSGNPLRMYTGTSKDIDFKAFKIPKNGAWFTHSPQSASDYAKSNDSQGSKYNPATRKYHDINTASRVMPVYLRITRPYKLSDEEMKQMRMATNYKKVQGLIFQKALAAGYDGIDMGGGIWVVIRDPNQVKSAIGNSGNYDSSSNDLIKETTQLSEMATDEIFHYTGLLSALSILQSGKFELSSTTGSIEATYGGKKQYFLSTTRTLTGAYHNYTGNSGVMFNLDGRWFNQRYKTKPVDYWGNRDPLKYGDSEAEDRVMSDKPSIPLGGISSIHVYANISKMASEDQQISRLRKIFIAAKQRNIQCYLYSDLKAWKVQDTTKTIKPSVLSNSFNRPRQPDYRSSYQPLKVWHELIFKDELRQLSDDARKKAKSNSYSWNLSPKESDGFEQDIGNARKPTGAPPEERQRVIDINKWMKYNDLMTPHLVAKHLREKWKTKFEEYYKSMP